MSITDYPYAGLILPDASDLDPGPYLRAAETALSKHDPVPGGRPHRSAHGHRVLGQDFGVIVVPEEDSDYGPRMLIEVITTDGAPPDDDEIAAAILSDTVLLALETSEADILEWYAPDVLIDREDFIRLRASVAPLGGEDTGAEAGTPAPSSNARFEDTDDIARALMECEEIAAGLRQTLYPPATRNSGVAPETSPAPRTDPQLSEAEPEDDLPPLSDPIARYKARMGLDSPQERRMRSAGWLMLAMITVISAPVGVFVYVISLFRGMEFRLVAQTLAVTALFVVLYNTDRMGQVLNQFMH